MDKNLCTRKFGFEYVNGKRKEIIHWNTIKECEILRYKTKDYVLNNITYIQKIVNKQKKNGFYSACYKIHKNDEECVTPLFVN